MEDRLLGSVDVEESVKEVGILQHLLRFVLHVRISIGATVAKLIDTRMSTTYLDQASVMLAKWVPQEGQGSVAIEC